MYAEALDLMAFFLPVVVYRFVPLTVFAAHLFGAVG